MQGFIFEKGFLKAIFSNRVKSGVDPTQRIQVLNATGLLIRSTHGTTAGHLPKTTHTTKPSIPEASYVTKP